MTDGLDPRAVRRQFGRRGGGLARADFLLREIERQMLERLDVVRLAPGRVLDIGCGLGRGLLALRQRYPEAALLGLDSSIRVAAAARGLFEPARTGLMARLLGPRGTPGGPVPLVCADVTAIPLAAASVDLAWSNLCLHWVDDLPAAFGEIYRVLRPEGLLMFSLFGVDTLKELRGPGDRLPRFVDMHDIGDTLAALGYADPVMDTHWITVAYDAPERLLEDLHAIGGNPWRARSPGLTSRGRRAAWVQALERLRGGDGRIGLTFEVVFGHAWCPAQKRRADGLTPIRFERG